MNIRMHRAESYLLLGLIVALVLACFGPTMTQYDHYHEFADQRAWLGLPFALDVLSNLPFALFGAWGLWLLGAREPAIASGSRRGLALLFCFGLVLTALCSSWYHFQPGDQRLAFDRLGMAVAFSGLLGMAVADRISERAGLIAAALAIVLGPLTIATWAINGNLLPWSVFQGGGMLLVVAVASQKPVAGAWGLPLRTVVGWYALAKVLELSDGLVFLATGHMISGHTLKHLAASMAAFSIIFMMHNATKVSRQRRFRARDLSLQ